MARYSIVTSLFLAALGCTTDSESGDTTDTSDTSDTDTGTDTDTGNDTDTGHTGETGHTGDTGDTGDHPPLPTTGYFGPPTVGVLISDGAGGASLVLLDPIAGTTTAVSGVAAETDDVLGCGGQYVWVLGDDAWGVSARDGSLGATLTLDDTYAPQVLAYNAPNFWLGGLGSANVLSFDETGTAGSSIDLSSAADADGKPEVVAFVQNEAGLLAVLRRQNGSSYDASGVAVLDLTAATMGDFGTVTGGNAGRDSFGAPGGVVMALERHGSTAGSLEIFDLSTSASGGEVMALPSDVVALAAGGSDGTIWVGTGSSGAVTMTHYTSDGTSLGSISTGLTGDLFAPSVPNVWSGEGSSMVGYDVMTGTKGSTVDVGGTVLQVIACQPPPMEPVDTADTAGNP